MISIGAGMFCSVQFNSSVLQSADLRPSKAFDAPITRGQEIEVFLALLNLTTTTCNGSFTYCGWCGAGACCVG